MPASRRLRAGRISETEEFEEIKPEKERERMICIKKRGGEVPQRLAESR